MRLLLDTHTLLWWTTDDKRLQVPERDAIADEDSIVWVSAASLWEISIKASLGRLELDSVNLGRELERNNFLELPILWRHAESAGSLPRHHDDPFDRMLIAQAPPRLGAAARRASPPADPALEPQPSNLEVPLILRRALLRLLQAAFRLAEVPVALDVVAQLGHDELDHDGVVEISDSGDLVRDHVVGIREVGKPGDQSASIRLREVPAFVPNDVDQQLEALESLRDEVR